MTRKKVEELKKLDKIILGGESLIVEKIEISEVGKQGVKKVRIEAKKSNGEKVVVIRPSGYPINVS